MIRRSLVVALLATLALAWAVRTEYVVALPCFEDGSGACVLVRLR